MKRHPIDINCDLGEGEPLGRTRALMRKVTSVNVACGGHAGTIRSMEACVALACEIGTKFGAHPGYFDRASFGRKPLPIDGDALELLLLQQVSALQAIAKTHRVPLHHIKLHGALYHAVESERSLARCYLAIVKRHWPRLVVYALAGENVQQAAATSGVTVWGEAFADRRYGPDGKLVPRHRPGAVLATVDAVRAQVRTLLEMARVDTICIHSDTPNALRLADAVAKLVRKRKPS